MTDVLTTCAVVIFRVKLYQVSWWYLTLVNDRIGQLSHDVIGHLCCDVIGYEDTKCHWFISNYPCHSLTF